MKRDDVQSSNIKAIGYENETLEIEFLNGSVYQYFDVQQNIYDEMMAAESKGKYLAQNIKGRFRFSKV
jgi:KTSC domain-containing protein